MKRTLGTIVLVVLLVLTVVALKRIDTTASISPTGTGRGEAVQQANNQ